MAPRMTWVPPDGGWGWMIVVVSMMLHAHTIGLLMSMGVLYVSWLETFEEGRGVTSWILSIAFAVTFGFGPLPAALANTFGFRVVTVLGGLLSGIGLILCYFATSVGFLVVGVGLITGTGCSFLYLSGVAIVTAYFSKRRSIAMGIGATGGGIGALIGGPVINYLINTYGWRGALLLMGATQFHTCIFGLLIRPLEKVEVWDDEDNEHDHNDSVIVVQEINFNEKNFTAEESYENINAVEAGPDDSLKQIRAHLINRDTDGCDTPVLDQSKKSMLNPHNEFLKISNGSLAQSNGSLQRFKGSLMIPFTHHPSQQRAKSMMKIHNGSLLSINKPRVYCSLRSLNSNGKRSNIIINRYDFDPKSQRSMDVVLARSIKHLRSISLLGALPNRMIESIREINDTDSRESKTPPRLSLENGEEGGESSRGESTRSWKETLKDVLHHNAQLLRDPTFLQFAISNFATNISYAPPVMYLVDRAVDSNLDKTVGATLIAWNGIGNIIGRLFFGLLTYRLLQDRLMTYVAVLMSAGIFTLLSPLCGGSAPLHGIYATLIGTMLGAYCVLVAVTTADIMGMEKASSSFGLLLMFMGIATLIGPPIGGVLFDWTKSYTLTYLIYGVALIISAIVLLPLACRHRRTRKRQEMTLRIAEREEGEVEGNEENE